MNDEHPYDSPLSARPVLARSIAALLLLLVLAAPALSACPNCGVEVLASGANDAGLVRGYTLGAIGLAGAPFLLAGGMLIYILRAYRRGVGNE